MSRHIRDDAWRARPDKGRDRPTRERLQHGEWGLVDSDEAGARTAVDFASHPIDRLQVKDIIDNDQASAARQWESLYRAANECGGIRDSTTLWEPKGFESDDGPVDAVQERREVYLALGTLKDQLLRQIILTPRNPRTREIEMLREALDILVSFWKR